MELQQIFVYDIQRYFFRFLNSKFKFNFIKIKNNEMFYDINKFSIIFYVIYSEEEIENFFKIYSPKFQFLVCIDNNNVLNRMENIENVILIDTSQTKFQMANKICEFLECKKK